MFLKYYSALRTDATTRPVRYGDHAVEPGVARLVHGVRLPLPHLSPATRHDGRDDFVRAKLVAYRKGHRRSSASLADQEWIEPGSRRIRKLTRLAPDRSSLTAKGRGSPALLASD